MRSSRPGRTRAGQRGAQQLGRRVPVMLQGQHGAGGHVDQGVVKGVPPARPGPQPLDPVRGLGQPAPFEPTAEQGQHHGRGGAIPAAVQGRIQAGPQRGGVALQPVQERRLARPVDRCGGDSSVEPPVADRLDGRALGVVEHGRGMGPDRGQLVERGRSAGRAGGDQQ